VPALIGRADANHASKRLATSLDDYSRVIEADLGNALAYFKRGNIHLDRREFDAAFSDYSASLKLEPNQPVTFFNRAIAAGHLGRLDVATEDEKRARKLDSDHVTAAASATAHPALPPQRITAPIPAVVAHKRRTCKAAPCRISLPVNPAYLPA
jgi:tetratricopeptide (TPR) repeat protein